MSLYFLPITRAMAKHSASQDVLLSLKVELNRSARQMVNVIRSAEVHQERATLTAFLATYLSPDANEARYEWLYCKNPEGVARVWVACTGDEGMVVVAAGACPRQVSSRGEMGQGSVQGD